MFQDAGSWPVYRYKIAGARKSHAVAIDPVLHPRPQEAWAARIGQTLELFEAVDQPKPQGVDTRAEPILRLPVAPSIVSDIFGTDRRDPTAPPLPAAPVHVLTHAGHVRFWADGGEGQPILLRLIGKPAQTAPRAPVEPLLTAEAICSRLGISSFALKNAMGRSRYRKLRGQERERASIVWMVRKVGREQFMSAVRSLGEEMRQSS